MGGDKLLTRLEQIEAQLQNIDEQLSYTKTEVLIKNCHRTKRILENEREKISGSRDEVRNVDGDSGNPCLR